MLSSREHATGERVRTSRPTIILIIAGCISRGTTPSSVQPIDHARRTPTSLCGVEHHPGRLLGLGQYAPRDGRIVQNRDVKLASADAVTARIEIHNDWNVNDRKMAEETTMATLSSATALRD